MNLRSLFGTRQIQETNSKTAQSYEVATPIRGRKNNVAIGAAINYFRFGMVAPPLAADPIYRPLNAYSSWIAPKHSFAQMQEVYENDAECSFGIDWLASVSVGMGHHFTAAEEYRNLVDYITEFAYEMNLDEMALNVGREVLAYGNSLWSYKEESITEKSFDIIEPLALTSLRRIWWDGPGPRSSVGYYEFRGQQTITMLPSEVLHFRWRTINSQPFGLGLLAPIVARPSYTFNRNGVDETRYRMSLYDIKNSVLDTAHKIMKRYVPRNVYNAVMAKGQQLSNMQAMLDELEDEQDVVLSGQNVITELGKGSRAVDLESFDKLYRNEMIKAVATPASKLYETGSLTEASSKVAKEVALMHMNGFQRQINRYLMMLVFRTWYMANPKHDANGVVVPWKEAKFELHWGQAEKPKMEPQFFVALVNSSPGSFSHEEIRKYASSGGVELIPDTWTKPQPMATPPMQDPFGQQKQDPFGKKPTNPFKSKEDSEQ